jgi:DNA-binding response OmpR family regulator
MAKVMLVEDDNNLREIYEARLLAEGYEIVSAQDGEEALALAVKEKPDLIIADIMMPKISGFDMLDILRSTPETKYTKVIMMTALSQAEDKARATKLGADRYLVKSQVTLEDVARVAKEVLAQPSQAVSSPPPTDPAAAASTTTGSVGSMNDPADPQTRTNVEVDLQATQVQPPAPTTTAMEPAGPADSLDNAVASLSNQQGSSQAPDSKTSVHTKVIAPINDLSKSDSDFQALLAKEEAKEAAQRGQAVSKSNTSGAPDPNSIAL